MDMVFGLLVNQSINEYIILKLSNCVPWYLPSIVINQDIEKLAIF